jgi:hypothetical protein
MKYSKEKLIERLEADLLFDVALDKSIKRLGVESVAVVKREEKDGL